MKPEDDDLSLYYAKMASETLITEVHKHNELMKSLGEPARMIIVHDDDTGLALSAYLTVLKKDWD